MKKMLIYSLLAAVLFGNSGAGCSGEKADDPQPKNFQSLIGKWEIQRFNYEIVKEDGKMMDATTELKSKGTILIWEFFSDGRLRATQDGKSREVRWELSVTRLSGQNIETGTLKIIGDEERKLAELFGQTGDLTYNIETLNPSGNNFAVMYLIVDATKVGAGAFKKYILTYTYHKL